MRAMETQMSGVLIQYDIPDPEPLDLADRVRFLPKALEVTYSPFGASWTLTGHRLRQLRRGEEPEEAEMTVGEGDFPFTLEAGHQIPAWVTKRVEEVTTMFQDLLTP